MKKTILILVLFTANLQSQWFQYPSGNFGGPLYFVHFVNNIRGFLGGYCRIGGDQISYVYETYDGGSSGVVINTFSTQTFYDFYYISSGNEYSVGSQKCVQKNFHTKTISSGNYFSISVPSVNTIYAVGDSPDNIGKSTNGGDNWVSPASPTTNTLKGVCFLDEMTGWICGQNGTLFKTINGGTSWTAQNQSASINFEKIFFINSNTGIVIGSGGVIMKTVNGGQTWVNKQSNVSTKLNGICFYAPNLFWAVGDAGKIIKSSDTGDSWFLQNTNNASVTFNAISAPSADTVFAVTSEGVQYRTINSGGALGIVNNQIPAKFELKQNYPNPFNPVTQIEYSLLKSTDVNISVYDITGKLVSVIVNGFQNYGTYRINFDAANLASGIYMYKIQTNEFRDIRKMILVK